MYVCVCAFFDWLLCILLSITIILYPCMFGVYMCFGSYLVFGGSVQLNVC